MSKYFAKYLPVEEEIRTGDKYFTKGAIEVRTAEIPETYNNPYIPYYDGYKKAKLFLCSRDIQLGDWAMELLINGEYEVFSVHTVNDIHSDRIDAKEQFKVIGEISPEVDWLNDNQEVPEISISLWKETAEISIGDIERIGGKIGEPIIYGDDKVRIKCPCCKTYK